MKSFPALLLQLVLSLGFVLALMYGCARLLRRINGGATMRRPHRGRSARGQHLSAPARGLRAITPRGHRTPRRPDLEVLARHMLGKSASVAVLRVGSRMLLVGVSDGSVRLLTDLDPAEFEAQAPEPTRSRVATRTPVVDTDVTSVLDLIRERTVRRA